jgi:hypothetical protein
MKTMSISSMRARLALGRERSTQDQSSTFQPTFKPSTGPNLGGSQVWLLARRSASLSLRSAPITLRIARASDVRTVLRLRNAIVPLTHARLSFSHAFVDLGTAFLKLRHAFLTLGNGQSGDGSARLDFIRPIDKLTRAPTMSRGALLGLTHARLRQSRACLEVSSAL